VTLPISGREIGNAEAESQRGEHYVCCENVPRVYHEAGTFRAVHNCGNASLHFKYRHRGELREMCFGSSVTHSMA
jgi:hypothetical protein